VAAPRGSVHTGHVKDDERIEPGKTAGSGHPAGDAGAGTRADEAPSRVDWLLHIVLLVWGAVMLAVVLVGIVGFLVYFFLLQR